VKFFNNNIPVLTELDVEYIHWCYSYGADER